MKAICNQQYKALEGVFDKGDKVEIEVIRYEEDTQVQGATYAVFSEKESYLKGKYVIVHVHDNRLGKAVKIFDEVIAPKDSYKGYRIKSKNGEYYDDGCIRNIIGYKSLGDIFEPCKS